MIFDLYLKFSLGVIDSIGFKANRFHGAGATTNATFNSFDMKSPLLVFHYSTSVVSLAQLVHDLNELC